MKRIISLGIIVIMMATICMGCGKDNESESVSSEDLVIDTKPTYEFVDVLGNEYEAELLEDVPMTFYDELKKGTSEDGYYEYTDQTGEVVSVPGIDVSKYQGEVDWKKVKEAGIEFAIIRLGVRGYGEEGIIVEDEYFKQNIEGALDAGVDVGVYFFSQAINEEETLEEAKFVLDRIKDYEIACPVVFDTEEIKDAESRTDAMDKAQFTDNCVTFCEEVKKAGYEPMIYANMKWMAFTLDLTKLTEYEKWYADYEPDPQCPYEFTMWQYTETGSVPGVEGNVDLNVWFKK